MKRIMNEVKKDEEGDDEEVVRTEFEVHYPDGRMTTMEWTLRVLSGEKAVELMEVNGFQVVAAWKSFKDAMNDIGREKIDQGSTVLQAKPK
eukprot:TRINITY_DN62136_c0_g1_i1.p2 TRINITY_DN62136_c0_g1~~TRINITY_DN62136_c0_g1_i1.p2  ORF type:complete len:105 (-),score=27.50 TRINITY_DN62136_c0_g1_i1:89-361(-)